jgi:erythromycin esterase-like protein
VKVTEKKKKKEKKQNEENPKEQKDDAAQNTFVGASDAVEGPEKPKDKKKKKKLKKVHSTSTSTAPEVSIPEKQLDNLQGTDQDKPKNSPQEKISEHNNESSNSCLQPPPVKVLSNTLFCI